MITALGIVILLIGVPAALAALIRRTTKCAHPGIVFARSSGMVECRQCGQLVEWADAQ